MGFVLLYLASIARFASMHCASRAASDGEGAAGGEEAEVSSLKSISSGAWSEYLASPMGLAAALIFALRQTWATQGDETPRGGESD